jgi:hypothetical protein
MTGRRARFGIVLLAVVLFTLALGVSLAHAVTPAAPATLGATTKAPTAAPAETKEGTAAAEKKEGAAGEPAPTEAAAEGEGAAKAEMDFKVGNLTAEQKTAVGEAGTMGVEGYNVLIVGFLGVMAICGIIVMGAYFQMKA